ncbi:hypothetical protein jhhlp_006680 [Lomentospora prolificans]|uniref:NmrA-like domain-containing protein n=1 Tax=Lomentospora prolificans TaxID=41688 RepID=A0A2N3N6L1_9PEZI|nr:hypothetical protein jhhlp_006680 [Lomentospora prolificans]
MILRSKSWPEGIPLIYSLIAFISYNIRHGRPEFFPTDQRSGLRISTIPIKGSTPLYSQPAHIGSNMRSIGIFPASGGLGTSTYTHLLKSVPNDNVTLISRYPEKVPDTYTKNGVRLRKASYESDPKELEIAFTGIEVLFLISYPSHVHDYRVKVQLPAIDAAVRAGVKHIFYSSLGFAGNLSDQSLAVVMQAHLDSEKHLASVASSRQDVTYTSIREGLYSESFPIYTAFFDPENPVDEILIPHSGSGPGVSWVKRDELGEATSMLIQDYAAQPDGFKYTNSKLLLTGNKPWSLADTVKCLGETIGKEVRIREVTVDEYAAQPQVEGRFGSMEMAKSWATAWEAIRAGETAIVTPTLAEILGRTPEDFDKTIKDLIGQARD